MSLSTDCRIASLVAFAQARAMGAATNAAGGAFTGASDCGRTPDGKFGSGNKCAGNGSQEGMPKTRIEDPRIASSWLSPAGDFHPVARTPAGGGKHDWTTHHQWAVQHGVQGGENELLGGGWMRVQRIGGSLFAANESDMPLTAKQSKNLIDHAQMLGYEEVVHELSGGRSKVIWSKYDRSLRAFCPTGEGGGVDNSCGISNSQGERIRNVRTKSDKLQTKVARKLYQMRTTEKQIKKLIRDLGGKVSNSIVEIESTRGEEGVNIFIRDRNNNETHFIHMGYYGASVYTSDKVSVDEAKRIRAAAEEAFPKTVDKRLYGRGRKYNIDVVNDPTQTKTAWDGLSSKQRFKAKLDARYASLLAFAESRDCGRDPDGKFSSGNTCASGVAVDAAKGAVTGAAKGAIAGLFAGGPAVVKPAAAIGAATGVVKGVYDNQMRPTRVKRAIEKIGMTVEQVGSLVERLGGTPDSSADTRGGALRLTIRDKNGKKSFHVEVNEKTITVYPRRATGELTGREISRVKKIADESTPKSVSVVVKKSSSAYVSKLVRNGFTLAAGHAADVLVATYLAAPVHSFAHDAVQSIKKTFSRR